MPQKTHLQGARVYLSGPMDFVASRAQEMKLGWRNRVGQFLRAYGVTVFDPWNKPGVRGLHEYGREGPETHRLREAWTFAPGPAAAARAAVCGKFWEALHIDLRMVDTSDFTRKLENPLLPFLEKLNDELPKKWDNRLKKHVPNDDWLLWDL